MMNQPLYVLVTTPTYPCALHGECVAGLLGTQRALGQHGVGCEWDSKLR
jgi:hypothetical protein